MRRGWVDTLNQSVGMLTLAVVAALLSTLVMGRIFMDQPAVALVPGVATLDQLVAEAESNWWSAVVEVPGEEEMVMMGPRNFLDDWQQIGVEQGPPHMISIGFSFGQFYELTVIGRVEEPGVPTDESVTVMLRTPEETYNISGECEINLVWHEYIEELGRVFSVRGQIIDFPSYAGTVVCEDILVEDSDDPVTIRAGFHYDRRES